MGTICTETEWPMKNKISRILATLALVVITGTCAACGASQQASLDPAAAVRGKGVGAGETYIDDQAIALAGETPSSSDITSAATSALALVNVQRANAGLAALQWSDGLAEAAMVRAQEIVGTFSHTRPNGSDWWTVNSNLQYGENLAKLYGSADSVVAAWMASPTHKANILDSGYKTCGISIYKTGDGQWYWAQEFGY